MRDERREKRCSESNTDSEEICNGELIPVIFVFDGRVAWDFESYRCDTCSVLKVIPFRTQQFELLPFRWS